MPQKYDIVIADASCFILLDKIGEIYLLEKVFHSVTTTDDIASEYGKPLPSWVKISNVANKNYQSLLQLTVDSGEASAIALSVETGDALLILDDIKGRRLAEKLQLQYIGTLGVILKAKQMQIIPKITPVFEKIQQTNFRFSEKLYLEFLKVAGE